jgi:uncharacterized membrane protein YfcA
MMIAAVALAAFLIGFNKAGVAGTLGPFVTVLLVLTMPAGDAVGLLLPILIVADWFTLAAHWGHWDSAIYLKLLLASLIGIAAGSLVISAVSETVLRRIIALAMLAFALFYVTSRSIRLDPSKSNRYAWPAGAASGLVSTLAHLGGPPIFVYLMTTNLNPRRFVATSAVLFATINLLKVPGYFLAGLFDGELILSTIWAWAMIPIGVLAGRALVGKINRDRFERVTVLLLTAGAVLLLVV